MKLRGLEIGSVFPVELRPRKIDIPEEANGVKEYISITDAQGASHQRFKRIIRASKYLIEQHFEWGLIRVLYFTRKILLQACELFGNLRCGGRNAEVMAQESGGLRKHRRPVDRRD